MSLRKRIEHAIDSSDLPAGGEALLLRRQPVVEHLDLQGHADGGSDGADVPRFDRPGDGVGAGAGAPAFQHQYISVVAARASLPFCRPQRRDQHAARQYQLDEGARSAAALRRARPRPLAHPADHSRGRERHGNLRQRPRAPGDGRAVAAACRADDDPRAVAEQRGHEPGAARVLRIPLVADGAVGRSGVDCLHRRHGDWRGARSQRAAPVALLRHQGRSRRDGLGSRRPRHSCREHPRQGTAAPGQDLPRRHGTGPHHRRRRDQGAARARSIPTPTGSPNT